jgi:hypothetical protein
MILDFTMDGHVIINMTEYIKTIITDFSEEITTTKTTPAADHTTTTHSCSTPVALPEEGQGGPSSRMDSRSSRGMI